jgi:catechol 2,3-dioxygenase-like lactoylglutathione lyase family enzyme
VKRFLKQISILVRDYDEALEFYIQKLHFSLIEDTRISAEKRWVVISPSKESQCHLLLAKAKGEVQYLQTGHQSGGRVFLFLYTDDFEREYNLLISNNIEIVRLPVDEPYGKVLVFKDLYGNLWDLIQPNH